jgi:lipid-A-disaccharide synthase
MSVNPTQDIGTHRPPPRIFVVAGEHSGDALGAKLIAALKATVAGPLVFGGVGGDHMQRQGFDSLFPMSDVAVMGPIAILKKLRPIVRRVYQTVDAAIAFAPDVVVIVDSPEFTHPIAKRIRKRRPDIPIVDYVSPTVWAWRPGRAPAMRGYVDHVLALLPFEPDVHARLGGPACTYAGHPLIERRAWIDTLDTAPLRAQLRLADGAIPLVVLPGSRRSEITRLLDTFKATVALIAQRHPRLEVLMPVVPNLAGEIRSAVAGWSIPVHIVEGEDAKWRAFKLGRAALAASGTVTLELALAGTPMVVGYRVEKLAAMVLKRMAKAQSAVLPNLILGDNAFPEFLQDACTPENMAAEIERLLAGGDALARQKAALQRLPGLLELEVGTPSQAAAAIVLDYAWRGRH